MRDRVRRRTVDMGWFRHLAVLLILGLTALHAVPARAVSLQAPGSWDGTYQFDGAAGHTAGGSPIIYHYTLSIRRSASAPCCELKLEGYQQNESLRCAISGDRQSIDVAFTTYANGSVLNIYGTAIYRPGEPLFRLAWQKHGGRDELRTTWLALHPDGIPDVGVFFRQAGR